MLQNMLAEFQTQSQIHTPSSRSKNYGASLKEENSFIMKKIDDIQRDTQRALQGDESSTTDITEELR